MGTSPEPLRFVTASARRPGQPATIAAIVGPLNEERHRPRLTAVVGGTLDAPQSDIDDPAYRAITREVIDAADVHGIDRLAGLAG